MTTGRPSLRLVRRRHRPLRHPGQRHHRLLPDQARRAVQPGDRADLRRLHRRRRAGGRHADDADRFPPREPIYEECPAGGRTSPRAARSTSCRKARDYVLRLEELAGAQVSCIGVGPAGTRPLCGGIFWHPGDQPFTEPDKEADDPTCCGRGRRAVRDPLRCSADPDPLALPGGE